MYNHIVSYIWFCNPKMTVGITFWKKWDYIFNKTI